jgi:hypothetical protein
MRQENDNIKEKVFRDHLSYLRSELEKTQKQLEIVSIDLIHQRRKYDAAQYELQRFKSQDCIVSVDKLLINICKN